MGMFDWVEYSAPCRNCGEPITGWQSKDGPCSLDTLSTDDVSNFYAMCPQCEEWNEYDLVPPTERKFVLRAKPEGEQ